MKGAKPEMRKFMFNFKKSKAVPVHVIKAYRGRRGISPLILILSTSWV
jgi:hypothetical protein